MMRLVRNLIRELLVDAETRINKLDYIAKDARQNDPNPELTDQAFKARNKFNKMMQIFENTLEGSPNLTYQYVNNFGF